MGDFFGFQKLLLIGAVALIVLGPEKLPRVARTLGHLLGKARRYMADVKAEVNRSMELEELRKVQEQFTQATQDVQSQVQREIDEAHRAFDGVGKDVMGTGDASGTVLPPYEDPFEMAVASARHHVTPVRVGPRKNWRVRRGRVPQWFRQQQGLRQHVQSGAARVARHKPKAPAG